MFAYFAISNLVRCRFSSMHFAVFLIYRFVLGKKSRFTSKYMIFRDKCLKIVLVSTAPTDLLISFLTCSVL